MSRLHHPACVCIDCEHLFQCSVGNIGDTRDAADGCLLFDNPHSHHYRCNRGASGPVVQSKGR